MECESEQQLPIMESLESLDQTLTLLWRTRKSGLSASDKSTIQSLLRLPSLSDVDPVVASLRVLVRKYLQKDCCSSNEIMKMFPPGLPIELQENFAVLLQKNWSQWKQEVSRDQRSVPKSSLPYQTSTTAPSSGLLFPSSEISQSMWSWLDHLAPCRCDALGSTPATADPDLSHLFPISNQQDVGLSNSLGTLPHLISVSWVLENRNMATTNQVAIITLKLLDYTKSPVEESEVKFQLNRDTLEAMIRSMTHISEQFSRTIGSSSGPMHKQQD